MHRAFPSVRELTPPKDGASPNLQRSTPNYPAPRSPPALWPPPTRRSGMRHGPILRLVILPPSKTPTRMGVRFQVPNSREKNFTTRTRLEHHARHMPRSPIAGRGLRGEPPRMKLQAFSRFYSALRCFAKKSRMRRRAVSFREKLCARPSNR